jgi:DNA invertase Pin-like site-specific DNA recombinase
MEKRKMIVGYCRAASVNQVQIDRQKKVLRELAKKRNLRISKFYSDNGYSAGTLERPEFEQLMADCRTGRVGMVLVTETHRIARETYLLGDALEMFGKYKVRVQFGDAEGLKYFRTIMKALEPSV